MFGFDFRQGQEVIIACEFAVSITANSAFSGAQRADVAGLTARRSLAE
jgi:hypothetical protein